MTKPTEVLEDQLKAVKKNLESVTKQINSLNAVKLRLQEEYDEIKSKIATAHVQHFSKSFDKCLKYDQSINFPWSAELCDKASQLFRIKTLRPLQVKAINALLDGQDVILVMPTGAGKSLVYQLPAFMDANKFKTSGSITLVISPLVSLMADQLINLTNFGISSNMVAILDSKTPLPEQKQILAQLSDKSKSISQCTLRLLYVTPEKLAKSKLLLNRLESAYSTNRLARIAIDEIHCTSQWGHDFRPDYKFLHILKRQFPTVPILGLTATASVELIVDIQKILGLKPDKCLVLRANYNRKNLYYEVESSSAGVKMSVERLFQLIDERYRGECGIVYCFSQKDAEDVAAGLESYGLKAACYHANLDFNHRSKVHSAWSQGHLDIIVATVAFGMGINKADVRFVLHYTASKSLENYYQESGRAGRDSKSAECLLIWRFSDLFRLAGMVSAERTGLTKLYQMVAYCINPVDCRRYLIAKHLDDASWSPEDCSSTCDNCRRKSMPNAESQLTHIRINDLLKHTISLLQHNKQGNVTGPKLVDLMHNDKTIQDCVSHLICQPSNLIGREFFEYFIAWCLVNGLLKLDFHYTPYSTICYIGYTTVNVDNGSDVKSISQMPYIVTRNTKKSGSKFKAKAPRKLLSQHVVELSSDSE